MKFNIEKEQYLAPEIDALDHLESGIICTASGEFTIDDTEDGYTL